MSEAMVRQRVPVDTGSDVTQDRREAKVLSGESKEVLFTKSETMMGKDQIQDNIDDKDNFPHNSTTYDKHRENDDVKNPEDHEREEVDVFVELKKLPSFSVLNAQVQEVIAGASWWQLHGRDCAEMLAGVPMFFVGLWFLHLGGTLLTLLGLYVLGFLNAMWSIRGGHLAVHGALTNSTLLNRLYAEVVVCATGGFSSDLGYDIHIKGHHPHTNIIGLGDSSTWKVPFLGAHVYLYLAPVLFPLMSPLASLQWLISEARYISLAKFLALSSTGLAFAVWLLMQATGYSLPMALLLTFAYRAVFSIPYVHVNIFQHIGLPMYSPRMRPVRLYQMAHSVLNVMSSPILDRAFGHSVVSCHIEHHLFPRLSDNMCLTIRPLVKDFLVRHGLPYQERDYMERLKVFTVRYDEYMVRAPPITKFIGIQ